MIQVDFQNSSIFEQIANASEDKFIIEVNEILKNTHPYFEGYKEAILDFLNLESTNPNLKAATLKHMEKLNKEAFIFSSVLANHQDDVFCKEFNKFFLAELPETKKSMDLEEVLMFQLNSLKNQIIIDILEQLSKGDMSLPMMFVCGIRKKLQSKNFVEKSINTSVI